MPLAKRVALVLCLLGFVTVACGAANDRNSRLGTGADTCLDIDSDCTASHDCCSSFCANGTCVRFDR